MRVRGNRTDRRLEWTFLTPLPSQSYYIFYSLSFLFRCACLDRVRRGGWSLTSMSNSILLQFLKRTFLPCFLPPSLCPFTPLLAPFTPPFAPPLPLFLSPPCHPSILPLAPILLPLCPPKRFFSPHLYPRSCIHTLREDPEIRGRDGEKGEKW